MGESESTDTVGRLLCRGAAVLRAAGIDGARREARLLLAHALGCTPTALLADRHATVSAAQFDALLRRRAAREPLAFITGRQGFWTLDLAVSPATLIPRADSEALVEAALEAWPDRQAVRRMLDLGTGTGCLLLAALAEFPRAWGVGIDLSPAAAALAARNARSSGVGGRAAFLAGNWAAALAEQFDLVLCNPPYIPSGTVDGLMPEVAAHEPRRALDGGPDGLEAYRQVAAALPVLLAPRGVAVLELGLGQADAVAGLAQRHALAHIGTRSDLAGVPRALILRRGG